MFMELCGFDSQHAPPGYPSGQPPRHNLDLCSRARSPDSAMIYISSEDNPGSRPHQERGRISGNRKMQGPPDRVEEKNEEECRRSRRYCSPTYSITGTANMSSSGQTVMVRQKESHSGTHHCIRSHELYCPHTLSLHNKIHHLSSTFAPLSPCR